MPGWPAVVRFPSARRVPAVGRRARLNQTCCASWFGRGRTQPSDGLCSTNERHSYFVERKQMRISAGARPMRRTQSSEVSARHLG